MLYVFFSAEVMAAIRGFGIDPVRTAYRSPWQNAIAERVHTRLGDSPEGRPIETRPSGPIP